VRGRFEFSGVESSFDSSRSLRKSPQRAIFASQIRLEFFATFFPLATNIALNRLIYSWLLAIQGGETVWI
jgi:hypothetical protein